MTPPALVLEYVPGPTLQDRIAKGPIPLDEALPIARQIAEALEAAHEQGIIHRDLKPANVKVKDDGTVKVLDFGLAKALQPELSDLDAANSPTMTMTAAATKMGVIMGTAAYMSPEQAKGRQVDKRADIWAFGVVLYEMLTGRQAFGATDISQTLAFVLTREIEWTALPTKTPASVRRMLRRCMTRDRKNRLADMSMARVEIDEADAAPEPSAGATKPIVPPALWQRPATIVTMLLGAVVVTGLAVGALVRPEVVPANVMRFTIVPPEDAPLSFGGNPHDLAISSDGTFVVYDGARPGAAGPQLHVRPIDQAVGAPLRGSELGFGPFVSPDGEWIGFQRFRSPTTLLKILRAGGPQVTVTESPSPIQGASWGADDRIVFGTLDSGLFRVSAGGGEPVPLTTLDAEQGDVSHAAPFVIPGRAAVLFVIRTSTGDVLGTGQLAALDLGTGALTRLVLAGVSPRYVPTGHLVYAAQDGSVRAAPFDVESLTVTGNPVPLLEGVVVKTSGAADFDISDDGTLVYATGSGADVMRTVMWIDGEGRAEPVAGLDAGPYVSVAVSPDGRSLALELGVVGSDTDISIYDVARGTLNPLTTEQGEDGTPLWSPDGRQIVFASARGAGWGLYRRNADGTGEAELLVTDDTAQDLAPVAWAADLNAIVVTTRHENQSDLMLFSLDGEPALEPLLDSEFNELRASVSPDGEWIAYESDRSGRYEVYVERFPDLGDRQLVSTEGGWQPRWSPDGAELMLHVRIAARDSLIVLPVTPGTALGIGAPRLLTDGAFPNRRARAGYDVAPDGRVIALDLGDDDSNAPPIHVVVNWFEELKARVPVP